MLILSKGVLKNLLDFVWWIEKIIKLEMAGHLNLNYKQGKINWI